MSSTCIYFGFGRWHDLSMAKRDGELLHPILRTGSGSKRGSQIISPPLKSIYSQQQQRLGVNQVEKLILVDHMITSSHLLRSMFLVHKKVVFFMHFSLCSGLFLSDHSASSHSCPTLFAVRLTSSNVNFTCRIIIRRIDKETEKRWRKSRPRTMFVTHSIFLSRFLFLACWSDSSALSKEDNAMNGWMSFNSRSSFCLLLRAR